MVDKSLMYVHSYTVGVKGHTYMWPGLQKSTMLVQKFADFSSLHYHNLVTIYTSTTKCLLAMQNLMGFLLQFTEIEYHNHS